jgi:predicted 3-demethylubiquinone-9 3-methyltransferase (glyoxalase superfamily)
MPQIITFLTFNNQAEEAARFYTSIFPGSRITQVTRYPDLGQQSRHEGTETRKHGGREPESGPGLPPAGSVMTVAFELLGRPFVALNGGPSFTFSQGISLYVECDTQEEVDRYWQKLLEGGGTPVACGWLTDRFGVSWQIDPKLLMEMISSSDPQRARKAMAAMMKMVKIDSAALKRAVGE